MSQEYSSEGAEVPNNDFTIPDGEYTLEVKKVKEGKSKNQDYQITCDLEVVEGDHKGFPVKFHRVTFIPATKNPKAAGMSLNFLKTLGQPHDGTFRIEPDNWVGKKFQAYLEQSEWNGFKSMKVKWFAPVVSEESIPF